MTKMEVDKTLESNIKDTKSNIKTIKLVAKYTGHTQKGDVKISGFIHGKNKNDKVTCMFGEDNGYKFKIEGVYKIEYISKWDFNGTMYYKCIMPLYIKKDDEIIEEESLSNDDNMLLDNEKRIMRQYITDGALPKDATLEDYRNYNIFYDYKVKSNTKKI